MTDKNPDPSHIRLAKRVADQLNCSRSTAEQFIEGGFVSVDGQVVEAPGARVRPDQAVTVDPDASLLELTPVTLLLHKPAGFEAGLGQSAPGGASAHNTPSGSHGSRSQGATPATTLLGAASHLAEDASGCCSGTSGSSNASRPCRLRPAGSWFTRRTSASGAS
jgi:23S rRNA pseudouridine2604 synthase